jgi:hypothetical protein
MSVREWVECRKPKIARSQRGVGDCWRRKKPGWLDPNSGEWPGEIDQPTTGVESAAGHLNLSAEHAVRRRERPLWLKGTFEPATSRVTSLDGRLPSGLSI